MITTTSGGAIDKLVRQRNLQTKMDLTGLLKKEEKLLGL